MAETCHIDFVEFPSADVAASREFFEQTFGWQHREQEPGYLYFNESLEGLTVGCGSPEFMFAPGTHLAYITVDDIAGKLALVAQEGGEVVRGKTGAGPELGYYALFKDPNGVLWGLWSRK